MLSFLFFLLLLAKIKWHWGKSASWRKLNPLKSGGGGGDGNYTLIFSEGFEESKSLAKSK